MTEAEMLPSSVRRVVLSPKGAKVEVEAGRAPVLGPGDVMIRTMFSVVSPGTERTKLELSRKSLIGKARSRPDLVRQTLDKIRSEGLGATVGAVRRKLGESIALGYSMAGEVMAVGERVEGLRPGDVVAAGGGAALHADVVVVPQSLVVRVPPGVPADAAAFSTLGAVSMHGFRLAGTQVGEVVVVVGLGLIGLLAGAIAKAAGCRVIGVDLRDEALTRARRLGFDDAVRPDEAPARTSKASRGRGADAVLLCAASKSNAPVLLAGEVARDKARVVFVGDVPVEVPRDVMFAKELEIVVSRSYGPGRYDPEYEEKGHDYPIGYVRWTEQRNMEAFVDLLAAGELDALATVTHRFPVQDAGQAYATLEDTVGSVVLLEYPPLERAPRTDPTPSRKPPRSPATKTLRVGLIGTGSFASRILVPAITSDDRSEIAVVASLQGRPPALDGARHASSPEEVLEDPDVHVVFVATRHDSHAGLAAAALRAGKSVFVEKPLALTRAEVDAVVDAWDASRGSLMAGFNRRHAPFTRAIVESVVRGEPAVVHVRVNAGPLPPDHWTKDLDVGGGRVVGEMCHFVDLASHLAGSRAVSVFAHAVAGTSPQGSEDVVATISYANGSVASIVYAAGGDPSTGKERVEVFCGGRTAVVDDWRALSISGQGTKVDEKGAQDKGHAAEVKLFLSEVRAASSLADSFRRDVDSSVATLAVVESLATGLPVEL
ncbi:MAG: bi-domain-containing oxidoreductase [Actinomycetota bacterium]|nr:bi-domain-containing oxidoreductase [Actinomycetota bacterium]